MVVLYQLTRSIFINPVGFLYLVAHTGIFKCVWSIIRIFSGGIEFGKKHSSVWSLKRFRAVSKI